MADIIEAFIGQIDKEIVANKKAKNYLLERSSDNRPNPEVLLGRFLSNKWNSNGDSILSVYELNTANEHFGKKDPAIAMTTKTLFQLEETFTSLITFTPVKLDAGKRKIEKEEFELLNRLKNVCCFVFAVNGTGEDDIAGTRDDRLVLATHDEKITILPFQRIGLICSIPIFDSVMYQFDSLCVYRYSRPPANRKPTTEFALEPVDGTQTYLSVDTNELMYGPSRSRWNAPVMQPEIYSAKTGKEEDVLDGNKPDRPSTSRNFEMTKLREKIEQQAATQGGAESGNVLQSLVKAKVDRTCKIFYTPMLTEPGDYTARLCLDDLSLNEEEFHPTPKQLKISGKSSYYNRYDFHNFFLFLFSVAICVFADWFVGLVGLFVCLCWMPPWDGM